MKLFKAVSSWAISAVLCAIAVEILGAVLFFHESGRLVYLNNYKAPDSVEPTKYKQRLHPYFGFTGPYSHEGPDLFTNSLGFGQNQKLLVPFKSGPDDFVVFIFGSSVAGNVVSTPQGGEHIQGILQRLPQLKGKKVIVYNMAQGPQKQPQQLMELAFVLALGQHIDLVLNIDGTVEFTAGLSNFESGIDPIFPPAATLGAIGRGLTPIDASAEDFYRIAFHLSRDRAAVKQYSTQVRESRSGLGFLMRKFLLVYYSRSLIQDLKTYDTTANRKGDRNDAQKWDDSQKFLSLDMALTVTNDNIIESIFQTWLRCSEMMKVMANANGAMYLEIIHPNPYFSKKKLTSSERAEIAAAPDYFRRGASEGHKLIAQISDALDSRDIIPAFTLFDDNPDTVYLDSTGHFTRIGETILGRYVAEQVAAKLDRTSRAGLR